MIRQRKRDYYPDTLAGRIARTRVARKMTQAELAERSGMTKSGILCIERRNVEPKIYTVAQIAKALSVTIDFLVFGSAP